MNSSKTMDKKQKSLKTHSTLNRYPQKVKDELFDNDFFDVRDLVQVKYEMLRKVSVDKKPISNTAVNFGFSRPVFYQSRKAFENNGIMGLIPKKRGPKFPHKVNQDVITFVQELMAGDEKLSMEEISRRVKLDLGIEVHPTNISRQLKVKLKKNAK